MLLQKVFEKWTHNKTCWHKQFRNLTLCSLLAHKVAISVFDKKIKLNLFGAVTVGVANMIVQFEESKN